MNKKIILSSLLITLTSLPTRLLAAAGSEFGNMLNYAATNAGYNTRVHEDALEVTLGKIAYTLFSFLGIIFTGLVIYGGLRWMTARGNEDEVQKAKRIIRDAAIGLIITLGSFSIWITIQNLLFAQ